MNLPIARGIARLVRVLVCHAICAAKLGSELPSVQAQHQQVGVSLEQPRRGRQRPA